MKFILYTNEFIFLMIFLFLGLTSCKHNPDGNAVGDSEGVEPMNEEIFDGLEDSLFSDSSEYLFFVENPAGSYDFQTFDFADNLWKNIPQILDRKFLPGPLHQGKLVYNRKVVGTSGTFYLMAKSLDRGDVIPVEALGRLEVNSGSDVSVNILIPTADSLCLDRCNSFDSWFTICDDFRSFIQEWLEKQFEPRSINRIQWKPFRFGDL